MYQLNTNITTVMYDIKQMSYGYKLLYIIVRMSLCVTDEQIEWISHVASVYKHGVFPPAAQTRRSADDNRHD